MFSSKAFKTANGILSICNSFGSLSLKRNQIPALKNLLMQSTESNLYTKTIHTTTIKYDLMEFFDNEKNWGENEVKVGRAWSKDELRIKSNTDLHKLWYILLKERNMLFTMEHECKEKIRLFISPERIDKVKISMENLETVVRERNQAYHQLETGDNGERPGRLVTNPLGIRFFYKASEHALPPYMNKKWFETRKFGYKGRAVKKFLLLYREKLYNEKRKAKNRARNEVMMLLRRNPNLNKNLLRERYPNVNLDKLCAEDKIRGQFDPKG